MNTDWVFGWRKKYGCSAGPAARNAPRKYLGAAGICAAFYPCPSVSIRGLILGYEQSRPAGQFGFASHRGVNAGIVEADDLPLHGNRVRNVDHVAEHAAQRVRQRSLAIPRRPIKQHRPPRVQRRPALLHQARINPAVEFESPGTFPEVTGFRGGGSHGLASGEWTDDTPKLVPPKPIQNFAASVYARLPTRNKKPFEESIFPIRL